MPSQVQPPAASSKHLALGQARRLTCTICLQPCPCCSATSPTGRVPLQPAPRALLWCALLLSAQQLTVGQSLDGRQSAAGQPCSASSARTLCCRSGGNVPIMGLASSAAFSGTIHIRCNAPCHMALAQGAAKHGLDDACRAMQLAPFSTWELCTPSPWYARLGLCSAHGSLGCYTPAVSLCFCTGTKLPAAALLRMASGQPLTQGSQP